MPKPGDIGFTRISGVLGWLVHLGQWVNGDKSVWTHVFLVLPNGRAIEASPGGARVFDLSEYDDREVVYESPEDLTRDQRDRIVDEARKLEETPYSFLDYLALFLQRTGLCMGITRRYVRSSGHMICSQLVDEAYRRGGYHLFDDGRWSQEVTPGDLAAEFDIG